MSIRWPMPWLWVVLCLPACSTQADKVRDDWPTECVGRLEMKLPGQADVAALPAKEMLSYFTEVRRLTGFAFPDGVPAPFVNVPPISHPLTEAERVALWAAALDRKKRVAQNNERRKREGRSNFVEINDLPNPPFDPTSSIGWLANKTRVAVQRVIGNSMTDWSEELSDAKVILNARPRPIFDVPKAPGLCMPYIFVPDDGSPVRNLSMSYRLKDHPDIQITLTDASAFKPEELFAMGGMSEKEIKIRNKNAEPDPEIADFWHMALNEARKYESQWLLPQTTRAVFLAGYEGRQSFVRLTMGDGTLNYGYYAVVRGNPDAKEDTPDIRLHVEQDVRLAQGKPPLTKEQFIDMAQAIAASVQRRPVSAR